MKNYLQEITSKIKDNKRWWVILTLLLAFFVIVVSLFSGKKTSFLIGTLPTPSIKRQPSKFPTPTPTPAPKVYIETYETRAPLPLLPDNVRTYTIKTNFSPEEVKVVGNKLGLNQYQQPTRQYALMSNTDNPQNYGLLAFNRTSGEAVFQSYGNHRIASAEQGEKTAIAQEFLSHLGLIDTTVVCRWSYERRDIPQVTFVECRRDWSLVGFPILNPEGVLNISETTPLSQIVLGQTTNTQTNDPGKNRPNEFNTATVAINQDGHILGFHSNIRQIVETHDISSNNNLLTPEEALTNFQNHKAARSLISVAGLGYTNYNLVYPNNQAKAQKATITDFILFYPEKLPKFPQSALEPYYLVRGTSRLDSGYLANFIEVVAALKNSKSISDFNLPSQGQVAGATFDVAGVSTSLAQDERSIKFESFEPTTNPSPQPTDTPPRPTPATTTTCDVNTSQFNPVIEVEPGLRIGVIADRGPASMQGPTLAPSQLPFADTAWYYLPGTGVTTENQLRQDIEQIANFLLSQPNVPQGYRLFDWSVILQTFLNNMAAGFNQCPILISGWSPTLFVSGKPHTQLTIRVNSNLTYVDTPASDGWWHVRVQDNSSLSVNGFNRPFLYYEYEPVQFSRPKTGWIIQKNAINQFAKDLSSQLALLPQEADRLVFELNHAAYNVTSDMLFIGLIDQREIDEKLPLTISPPPESVKRHHFYVGKADAQTAIQSPILTPVERRGLTLLELGANGHP
ncbi:hypothetical protein HY008_02775 [Candidatus Woesebacteria bacterium]|nr:hypothetical protein [Candidatus Woesebacteria bacterium]